MTPLFLLSLEGTQPFSFDQIRMMRLLIAHGAKPVYDDPKPESEYFSKDIIDKYIASMKNKIQEVQKSLEEETWSKIRLLSLASVPTDLVRRLYLETYNKIVDGI